MERDATGPRPCTHAAITCKGERVAGFLVGPHRGSSDFLSDLLDHRWTFADTHQQLATTPPQPIAQLQETLNRKREMLRIVVSRSYNRGFEHEQGYDGSAPSGCGKRRMVVQAEIALEPDELCGHI